MVYNHLIMMKINKKHFSPIYQVLATLRLATHECYFIGRHFYRANIIYRNKIIPMCCQPNVKIRTLRIMTVEKNILHATIRTCAKNNQHLNRRQLISSYFLKLHVHQMLINIIHESYCFKYEHYTNCTLKINFLKRLNNYSKTLYKRHFQAIWKKGIV